MNAAPPSDETKARFAELARKYEPKLPRKFAEMLPFKEWIRELRGKGASCDAIRTLLADVNVKVANDTVYRFCRDIIGHESRRTRKTRPCRRSQSIQPGELDEAQPMLRNASSRDGLTEQREVVGPWTRRKRGPRIADSKNL